MGKITLQSQKCANVVTQLCCNEWLNSSNPIMFIIKKSAKKTINMVVNALTWYKECTNT